MIVHLLTRQEQSVALNGMSHEMERTLIVMMYDLGLGNGRGSGLFLPGIYLFITKKMAIHL